jgi:small nuclear ribonucleoprotein (snRNP)-like protein
MIQDYHAFEPGSQVSMLVKPEDIQVMKKERLCNTFEGEVLEDNQVRFLDEVWDIPERVAERFEVGEEVEVLTKEGKKLAGVLKEADEQHFVLTIQKKVKLEGEKRPKMVDEDLSFGYDEIKYTKYLISFK